MTNELLSLACRLERLNEWRGGAEIPGYDPEPYQIGLDLAAAVKVIRAYANQDAPDHLRSMHCPQGWGTRENRDPECPACRRMGPP